MASQSKSRWALAFSGLLALVLGLVGGVLVFRSTDDTSRAQGVFVQGPNELLFEPPAAMGPDPFTPTPLAPAPLPVLPPPTTPGAPPTTAAANVVTSAIGTQPGLYGGSNDIAVCNAAAIAAFLVANPDKAAAFVAGLQADPNLYFERGPLTVANIPAYIATLTPVVLQKNTLVTNNGFSNGAPTPRQSLLEKGTAVLVDKTGVPRVKCYCGNPLSPPNWLPPSPAPPTTPATVPTSTTPDSPPTTPAPGTSVTTPGMPPPTVTCENDLSESFGGSCQDEGSPPPMERVLPCIPDTACEPPGGITASLIADPELLVKKPDPTTCTSDDPFTCMQGLEGPDAALGTAYPVPPAPIPRTATTDTTAPPTTAPTTSVAAAPTTQPATTQPPTTQPATTQPPATQPPTTSGEPAPVDAAACTPPGSTPQATITVRNTRSEPIQVVWHDFDCGTVPQGNLGPGESYTISSFLGHLFTAATFGGTPVSSFEVTGPATWTIS